MLRRFFDNVREPRSSLSGAFMLTLMNSGHDRLARWGLGLVDFSTRTAILDVGCGGGKNIENLLTRAPRAKVWGIDHSEASVKRSLSHNRKSVVTGRVQVQWGNVAKLPFADGSFDAVSAFETVYFWPGPAESFKEVVRVLRPDGIFMICNEVTGREDNARWERLVHMQVYAGEELKTLMESAGLRNVDIHTHENGKWLCVVGVKA